VNDAAAKIAKESYRTGKTVRDVALAQGVVFPERLAALLEPRQITERGFASIERIARSPPARRHKAHHFTYFFP
jgi:aspartate ammonia-lyase